MAIGGRGEGLPAVVAGWGGGRTGCGVGHGASVAHRRRRAQRARGFRLTKTYLAPRPPRRSHRPATAGENARTRVPAVSFSPWGRVSGSARRSSPGRCHSGRQTWAGPVTLVLSKTSVTGPAGVGVSSKVCCALRLNGWCSPSSSSERNILREAPQGRPRKMWSESPFGTNAPPGGSRHNAAWGFLHIPSKM